MRPYIASAIAVLVSCPLAFFAGAHSGLASAESECPPEAGEAAGPAVVADVEPGKAGAKPAEADGDVAAPTAAKEKKPGADDEITWPFRKWADDSDKGGDRIYSKVRFLWVRPDPKTKKAWLGYLSLGDSVRVKGGNREQAYVGKSHSELCDKVYAVEPRGYVCVGEKVATFDKDDPLIVQLRARVADRLAPYPYNYGESTSTPVYLTIPPKHKQRKAEAGLEDHLRKVRAARLAKTDEEVAAIDPRLVGVDVGLSEKEPPRLFRLHPRSRTVKNRVVRGSTIAFTDTFDAYGRSWLMSWDRGVIPRDKVKPYPSSDFHGVALNDKVKLPIAFFRKQGPKYKLTADNKVVPTGEHWPRHGHVMVTEETIDFEKKRYLVTREDGLLCSVDGISVPRRSHYIPPRIENHDKGRRTWIDISIMKGWLVAYELDKPVYATLISPGRGGIPKDGVDPLETASTPVGRYRITGKFVTATMVSNASKDIIHDEVMYTQNFSGPYALHGAYWHDEWGEKKSGGCVNLAPIDARRMFAWTEPQLPASWHGVQLVTGYENALSEYQNATLVYLHK